MDAKPNYFLRKIMLILRNAQSELLPVSMTKNIITVLQKQGNAFSDSMFSGYNLYRTQETYHLGTLTCQVRSKLCNHLKISLCKPAIFNKTAVTSKV